MTQKTDAHARRIQKGIDALTERYGPERLRVMSARDIKMHAGNVIKNDHCYDALRRVLKHFKDPFQAVCEMLSTHATQLASADSQKVLSA